MNTEAVRDDDMTLVELLQTMGQVAEGENLEERSKELVHMLNSNPERFSEELCSILYGIAFGEEDELEGGELVADDQGAPLTEEVKAQDFTSTALITFTLAKYQEPMAFPMLVAFLANLEEEDADIWSHLLPVLMAACHSGDLDIPLALACDQEQFMSVRLAPITMVRLLVVADKITLGDGLEFVDRLITNIYREQGRNASEDEHAIAAAALFSLLPIAFAECDALYNKHISKFNNDIKSYMRGLKKGEVHTCTADMETDLYNLDGVLANGVFHLNAWKPYDGCESEHHEGHEHAHLAQG